MLEKVFGDKVTGLKGLIVLFAAVLLVMIGGISAYFTDTDDKTNSWTVGNVDIALEEVEYDNSQDERENITPNQELTKDPVIENTGSNDAFVFMKVSVPKASVKVASDDGSQVSEAQQELFTYSIDPFWTLVKTENETDKNVYVYAYGGENCTALSPSDKTSSLFTDNKIKFVNVIEGQNLEGQTLEMPVEAFGIQTDNITDGNVKTPAAVWAVLDNQNSAA